MVFPESPIAFDGHPSVSADPRNLKYPPDLSHASRGSLYNVGTELRSNPSCLVVVVRQLSLARVCRLFVSVR